MNTKGGVSVAIHPHYYSMFLSINDRQPQADILPLRLNTLLTVTWSGYICEGKKRKLSSDSLP